MKRFERSEEDLERRMNEILTLRDEISLKLHLASMDLQDEWKKLERTMPKEQESLVPLERAREALDDLIEKLRTFGDRLRDNPTTKVPGE